MCGIVTGQAGIHFYQDSVVQAESRFHVRGPFGAADEEARRRQQHQGKAHLAHDQHISSGEKAPPLAGGYIFVLAILEPGNNIGSREVPGRTQPEQQRAEHAEAQRGCENARIGSGAVSQVERR